MPLNALNSIRNIGVATTDDFQLRRKKQFFNVINFVGIIISIPQIFIAFSIDKTAGLSYTIGTLSCVIAFPVLHYGGFLLGRLTAFIPVFIFCGLAAVRLGGVTFAHIPSFTVVVGIFIIFDHKKEWAWLLLFSILELAMFWGAESEIWKTHSVTPDLLVVERVFYCMITLFFIVLEILFYTNVTEKNENITNAQLREINKELVIRNAEKDILLKEVHHRVKNNLQVISSLLRLQSHEIKDSESLESFNEAINRVRAISNLHEKMYKSENILRVDIKAYLEMVISNLIDSYGIEKKQIQFEVNSELGNVQNDDIIPLSLILNEMVSNSLKHGFEQQNEGKIDISILSIGKGKYELKYTDTGKWKKQKVAVQNSSFGINLIEILTDQINGIIKKMPEEKDSSYVIHFKIA